MTDKIPDTKHEPPNIMYTRISVLYPPAYESKWGAIRPPVGLGYLSEMLTQQGIEHQIIDMSLGYSLKQVFEKIRSFQTDLLGVSMTSLFHQSVYEMLLAIKGQFPAIPIVAGGPHLSTMREQVLEECSAIDYGTTLEGEETLVELCQGKPVERIKGLLYRTPGARTSCPHSQQKVGVPMADRMSATQCGQDARAPGQDARAPIVYTGDREFIMDLDRLPFPKYEKFELEKYVAREIGVITSRGCPYSCTFCPVKTTIGRATRFRSVQPIVDELEYWHRKGYRDMLVLDDNFAMKQERVYAICDEIERRGLTGFRLRCGNGIRADHVDEPLLRRMYDVGFRYLSFGVESANEKVLKAIRKGENLNSIEQAVKAACEIGYDVTLFFIIGLPAETPEDAENSLAFAQKYPVFDAKFYNLIPFPKTDIYEWIASCQYFLHQSGEYLNKASHWDVEPLFETPEFPYAERIRMLQKAHAVRKQIRKAAMQRKLKKLGIFSHIGASLFVYDWVQDLLLHNRTIRTISERVFRVIATPE